jgi:hypothetical protein
MGWKVIEPPPISCRLLGHDWEQTTRIVSDWQATGFFCSRCNVPANPEAYWRAYGHRFGPGDFDE